MHDICGKEIALNAGDMGWIPGLGRSPEVGNGNPLQCPCLGAFYRQRSLAGYSPWGRKESDTSEQLSTLMYLIQVLSSWLTDTVASI